MSNPSNPESKPRIITRRNLLIGGATLGAVGVGVALQAAFRQVGKEVTSAPAVAASGITPLPENTSTPIVVPAIPTLTPRPTDIATAAPTAESSATNIPATATTLPSPTAIETVTLTSVPARNTPVEVLLTPEKIVLKEGDVYYGEMKGPSRSFIAISYQELDHHDNPTNDPRELLIYSGFDNGNSRQFSARVDEPTATGKNSFKGNDKHALHIENGQINNNIFSGDLMNNGVLYTFSIPLVGTDEKALLDACNNVRSKTMGIPLLSQEQMKLEINAGLKHDYITKSYSLP